MDNPLAHREQAGRKLRAALDVISDGSLHKQHARALGMSKSNLSKTLSGRRTTTAEDRAAIDAYLTGRSPGYTTGDVYLWYAPPAIETTPLIRDTPPVPVSLPDGPGTPSAPDVTRNEDPGNDVGTPQRHGIWLTAGVATAVVIIAAVVIGVGRNNSNSNDTAAFNNDRCRMPLGVTVDGDTIAVPPQAATFGCPTAPMVPWSDGWRQDFVAPDGTRGAAIGRTPDSVVFLEGSQWQSYEQVDRTATAAGIPLGFPTTASYIDAGYSLFDLDNGGHLIGEHADGPYFWLPGSAADMWHALGGFASDLGAPTSNPYPDAGRWRQDFVAGYASASSQDATEIAITLIDNPAASMRPEAAGVIMRQADGTGWWISAPGIRQWISDGGTWECLGGDTVIATDRSGNPMSETPGYVIATMTYTKNASCP